jgi:hypothetical protein
MNRQDALALQTILAEYVNDKKIRYDDVAADTRDGARQQRQIGKQIDTAVKLYRKLTPAPITVAREPKTVEVGRCACGAAVTIGDHYSIRTDGLTTISKVCAQCSRTHEIELQAAYMHRPVDWAIRTCICGEPVRVRNDYAGFGFPEYLGMMDLRGTTRKNRTTKSTCRTCGCKWSFTIRFGKQDGKITRTINNITVQRCRRCRTIDAPDLVPVEPARKA